MNVVWMENINQVGEDDAPFEEVITSMENVALVGEDTIDNLNTSLLSNTAPIKQAVPHLDL